MGGIARDQDSPRTVMVRDSDAQIPETRVRNVQIDRRSLGAGGFQLYPLYQTPVGFRMVMMIFSGSEVPFLLKVAVNR